MPIDLPIFIKKCIREVIAEDFDDEGWMQAVNVREKCVDEPNISPMKSKLKKNIDEIIESLLNNRLLLENPATVYVNGRVVAKCDSGPAVAFFLLIDKTLNKKKWFFNDRRDSEYGAWHSGIRVTNTPDFPNATGLRQNELRGRLWNEKKICSFYQSENIVMQYAKEIEELFDMLGEDIKTYKFDFGGSSDSEGLKPWPGAPKKAEPKIEIPPEIQKRIDALLPQIHLVTGDERKKIEQEIESLYKKAGVENAKAAAKAAYIKTSGSKKSPYEKGGGAGMASYYGRLPAIAEEKVQIYNKTLCPKVWDKNKKLDPEVRNALLRIAFDFYADTELNLQIRDVYLLGSVANYNWTPSSDMDLHILVDGSALGMTPENSQKFFRSLVGKWNLEHDINIKGHPVELYLQDVSEKNAATGVYSLTRNEWVREPMPEDISVDKDLVQKKYTTWVQRIEDAVRKQDEKKLKRILETLREYRKAGLTREGEFSSENLVFKVLRTRGYLEKIKDCYNQIYDKKMAVKDGFDPTSAGPNPDATEGETNTTDDFYRRQNDRMRQLEQEGYGAGKREEDRLKIANDDGSLRKWQIRSKDAPKTPKLPDALKELVNEILDETMEMLTESPRQETLKKNKKPLTDEERNEVMKRGAVWHHGPNGAETPAIWKAVVNGKTWYCCNTHRAIQIKPTLKGAIKAFDFIKTTS